MPEEACWLLAHPLLWPGRRSIKPPARADRIRRAGRERLFRIAIRRRRSSRGRRGSSRIPQCGPRPRRCARADVHGARRALPHRLRHRVVYDRPECPGSNAIERAPQHADARRPLAVDAARAIPLAHDRDRRGAPVAHERGLRLLRGLARRVSPAGTSASRPRAARRSAGGGRPGDGPGAGRGDASGRRPLARRSPMGRHGNRPACAVQSAGRARRAGDARMAACNCSPATTRVSAGRRRSMAGSSPPRHFV